MKPAQGRWKIQLLLLGLAVSLGCRDQAQVPGSETKATNPQPAQAAEANPSPRLNDVDPLANARKIEPSLNTRLSPAVAEIVKLAQGGVTEDVLLAYVEKTPATYNLSVEEILYLYDLGLPVPVISSLIRHSNGSEQALANANRAPAPEPAAPQYAPQPSAPQPTELPPPAPETAEAPAYATPNGVSPGPVVENYNTFYSELSPYGTWADLPDYGWCWQPYAATLTGGWRPYMHRGRWLYSDYGWYWQSDYSWGWAPFHYGRWCNYPSRGWFWVPDRVWGPSWVCFREADSYYGWAPLPPGAAWRAGVGFTFHGGAVGVGFDFGLTDDYFAFVPRSRFCDPLVHNHFVAGSRIKNVYKKSTVVNNYYAGANNTIINKGIPRDHVAAVTKTEIPKVTVRETPLVGGRPVKADRVEREGNSLVVYRPQLQNNRPSQASISGRPENFNRNAASANPSGSTIARAEEGRPTAGGFSKSQGQGGDRRSGFENVPSKSGNGQASAKPLENRGAPAVTQHQNPTRENIDTPARTTVPVFPQLQSDRGNLAKSSVDPRLQAPRNTISPPPGVETPSAREPGKSVYSNTRGIETARPQEPPRVTERPTTAPSTVAPPRVNPNIYQRPNEAPIVRPDYNQSAKSRQDSFTPRNPSPAALPSYQSRPTYSVPSQGQPFRPPPTVAQPAPRYEQPSVNIPRQSAPVHVQPPVVSQPSHAAELNRPNPAQSAPVHSAPPPQPSAPVHHDSGDRGKRDR